MISMKKKAFIIGILLVGIGGIIGILELNEKKVSSYQEDLRDVEPYEMNVEVDEKNEISKEFNSHLPLVIMDIGDKEIIQSKAWDSETKSFVQVVDDPYTEGNVKIIDNKGKNNYISDEGEVSSKMKMKIRGNTSSVRYDKKQYLMKLLNEDGSENKVDIMGMGKDHEWIINISGVDRSLIRNYLGFSIASEIMEWTPELKYIELVMKKKEKYYYEGVYLIMETIKRGEERLNIKEYDNKFDKTAYLLKRDRNDENAIIIDNYGRKIGKSTGYIEVKYPYKKNIKKKTIEYIEEDINEIEKIIYSEDKEEFLKYDEVIDIDSFVDYFIINELFTNYDSGYHSIFYYKNIGEKLKIGPVWDFDMAMNNYLGAELEINSTAMHDGTLYRELLRDTNFTKKIIERYKELRKNILSDEHIFDVIQNIEEYLGSAIERDNIRWEEGYRKNYKRYNVDMPTYKEDIEKIKSTIREHGKYLDENIESLYQFSMWEEEEEKSIFGEEKEIKIGSILAIIFIMGFIISIVLVQREE